MKSYIFLYNKKGGLGIIKNYRGITLTTLATLVYNALFLNHIRNEVKKNLRKIKTVFEENDRQLFQVMRSNEYRQKNLNKIHIFRFLQEM